MEIPEELGPRGRRLWASIEAREPGVIELTEPRRDIAVEACRCSDQLDALAAILEAEGLTVTGVNGDERVHPALAETNRLRPLMARLIVALRLPDETTGERAQRRGMRGLQGPPKIGSTLTVTALDRVARASAK